jgi:diphthine synthase
MALYIIGLGLCNQFDVTLRGLDLISKSDVVYLEGYTSLLQCSLADLEDKFGKKIIIANREMSEQGEDKIIEQAKSGNVAFLVIGDPFSATTHVEIFKSAKTSGVEVQVVNNASILNAIGITGLQLYKFGKTTSIPFIEDHPNLVTPYNVISSNQTLGMHTLCLLDLKPDLDRFMSVNEALKILVSIEGREGKGLISDDTFVVGCARLGCEDFVVKAGKLSDVIEFDFGKYPHCLIIPGKMHFIEEEMLDFYKN